MDEIVAETEIEEVEEEEVSELEQQIWSVVAFDSAVASGLTYQEARDLIAEKDRASVSGLCIVTDEAANRFGND